MINETPGHNNTPQMQTMFAKEHEQTEQKFTKREFLQRFFKDPENRAMAAEFLKDDELKKQPEKTTTVYDLKVGDKCFAISYEGKVWAKNFERGHKKHRRKFFMTKLEAELETKRLDSEEAIRKRIEELNQGWVPDWFNKDEKKYCVSYDHNRQEFTPSYTRTGQRKENWLYLRDVSLAERIIGEMETHFRIYFAIV